MEKSLVPEPGPIVRIKTFVAFSMFKKHHNFMLVKYKDLGRILGREEQKVIKGGVQEPPGDICLGCETTDECRRVNKGDCVTATCNKVTKKYCNMA
jgi:hypothetical protein